MAKSKTKQQEALQILDDLDSFTPIDAPPSESASNGGSGNPVPASRTSTSSNRRPAAATNPGGNGGETAEALAFLDEIQQKASEPISRPSSAVHGSSRSGTPTIRKSTERVKLGGGTPSSLLPGASASATSLHRQASSSSTTPEAAPATKGAPPAAGSGGGWGWGSMWNTATAAYQQARTVVDEQVKQLPKNEQARKWGEGMLEYAKNAQLEKLGQDFKRVGLSTLTDILNVVAPPIAEHEVIQVWLSHDMQGYDGIESLTYRSLARVMEQVEGGDLIVNRGNESKPREGSDKKRDLNAVDGHEAAIKLSQANIEEVIKSSDKSKDKLKSKSPSSPTSESTPKSESSITSPTVYSHVYLRIQPFFTTYHVPAVGAVPASSNQQLSFLLYLSDPEHQLIQTAVTQSIPSHWLAIWDQYDWVEDLVAEALRVGVEVVGQEYIVARMGWAGKEVKEEKDVKEKVKAEGEEDEEEEEEDEDDEEEEEESEEEDNKPPKP